jgi:hypothetical protein
MINRLLTTQEDKAYRNMHEFILQYVDPLLNNDSIHNGRCYATDYNKQQLNSNRGTVFSMRSVPRGCKRDKSRV